MINNGFKQSLEKLTSPLLEANPEVRELSAEIKSPSAPFNEMKYENLAPTYSEQVEQVSQMLKGRTDLTSGNWEKMTLDGRLTVLQECDNQIAAITKRTPYHIEAAGIANNAKGVTFPDGRIVLNSQLLYDSSPSGMRQCLETLIHEGRHAYQNYNMDISEVEPNANRIEAWRLNRQMGYETGQCSIYDYQKMGFKRYLAQPLEVDARVFTEDVLDNLGK